MIKVSQLYYDQWQPGGNKIIVPSHFFSGLYISYFHSGQTVQMKTIFDKFRLLCLLIKQCNISNQLFYTFILFMK